MVRSLPRSDFVTMICQILGLDHSGMVSKGMTRRMPVALGSVVSRTEPRHRTAVKAHRTCKLSVQAEPLSDLSTSGDLTQQFEFESDHSRKCNFPGYCASVGLQSHLEPPFPFMSGTSRSSRTSEWSRLSGMRPR